MNGKADADEGPALGPDETDEDGLELGRYVDEPAALLGEPVLLLALLASAAVLVLKLANGELDSVDDVIQFLAPLAGGALARSQVSPVRRRR